MRKRAFVLGFVLVVFFAFNAKSQDASTGTGWGNLFPSEQLVLNENFMGFNTFHTDSNPDEGNSDNTLDPVSGDPIYGFKNDSIEVQFLGSNEKATYIFKQCAFAPEWPTAYAYKNSTENSPNVSDGFVEISRDYPASGGNLPMIHGEFVLDLRKLSYVEIIQWSHSSTGGNKRGVMLEYSLDDGVTWDTLRYQPGSSAYANSFTKDIGTGIKTDNIFNCQPSAYGMTWEDGIWAENVMLRFGECGGQTPRIHDVKIYGIATPNSTSDLPEIDKLKIYSYNKTIRISKPADVAVYDLSGKTVISKKNTNIILMNDFQNGIYLVKAQVDGVQKTTKIIL